MTRLFLVPPEELNATQLKSEYRDIETICAHLRESLKLRGADVVIREVPATLSFGSGHAMFFYDKGRYLTTRWAALKGEMSKRHIHFDRNNALDNPFARLPREFNKSWAPDPEELAAARKLLAPPKPKTTRKRKPKDDDQYSS